jgi:6-phosphogluconolactonase
MISWRSAGMPGEILNQLFDWLVMEKAQIVYSASDDLVATDAAREWIAALAKHGTQRYTVAFSGGRIAKKFFAAVTAIAQNKPSLWNNVHFFWADERCVPPTDPESNFLLARQGLFDSFQFHSENIHRIKGELRPEQAAQEASLALVDCANNHEGVPVLDMVFLGMGEDGHVASLFPGTEACSLADEPIFRAVVASKPPPHRITIGYKVIEKAREVWVLASGAGKEKALKDALANGVKNPLGRVLELRKNTRIFTDIKI